MTALCGGEQPFHLTREDPGAQKGNVARSLTTGKWSGQEEQPGLAKSSAQMRLGQRSLRKHRLHAHH